jgi:hypothetical protein
MPDTPLAQRLLALFTSPACAEAIAGDFTEGRAAHGSAWFWRQTLTTAMALCGHTLRTAPLASIGVVAAGCVLFGALAFAGFAPTALLMFPGGLAAPVRWIWLSMAWWSAAFFTGFTLVHLSPSRGMAASVVLATLGEAMLLALRLTVLEGSILRSPVDVFLSIAMFAAVPLLAGSAFARRRIVATPGAPEPAR